MKRDQGTGDRRQGSGVGGQGSGSMGICSSKIKSKQLFFWGVMGGKILQDEQDKQDGD
jgi:hypothetical protein